MLFHHSCVAPSVCNDPEGVPGTFPHAILLKKNFVRLRKIVSLNLLHAPTSVSRKKLYIFVRKVVATSFGMRRNVGVTVRWLSVLVRVFDLILSLDLVIDSVSVSFPISQFICCASLTLGSAVPVVRWCSRGRLF